MSARDPRKHNRRSIRLKGYDYSNPGEYFLTICTHNRQCLFGDVVDGVMRLNQFGKIARNEWLRTKTLREYVILDVFVIMPNHMHAILGVTGNQSNNVGAYGHTPLQDMNSASSPEPKRKFRSPSKSVGAIVRGYKSAVTKQINEIRNTPGDKIWQRNYYEHIIRNDRAKEHIRNYIIQNPAQWHQDRNHPDRL